MQDIKLGETAKSYHKRDAVHIAVAPVMANETLNPGQSVMMSRGMAKGTILGAIGIVDPFLDVPVRPGQMFWLFMYPNSTKQLRHDWSHPDFPEEVKEKIVYVEEGQGCAC